MSIPLLTVLWITVKVATVATLIVAVPAIAVGYALSRWQGRGRTWLSACVELPLVLPPTAVGYLLLSLLAYDGPLGRGTLGIDLDLLFTWKGAALAACVMSLPLVVRTARVAFDGVDPKLEAVARTLGHSRWTTFLRFTLPLSRRGLIAALILGFTRAIGEFGATITVAGYIRGRTETLATAIFHAQQLGDDANANVLMWIALSIGLLAVLVSELLSRRVQSSERA